VSSFRADRRNRFWLVLRVKDCEGHDMYSVVVPPRLGIKRQRRLEIDLCGLAEDFVVASIVQFTLKTDLSVAAKMARHRMFGTGFGIVLNQAVTSS
jgi:hypothetical protein